MKHIIDNLPPEPAYCKHLTDNCAPGWYYWSVAYPCEGSIGPFETEELAKADALKEGYTFDH